MSARLTQFKIGLLAATAIVALFVAALALGLRTARIPTTTYHAFFDESVQGLEVGSPVKYRGVRIGNVDSIAIAPDGRHVAVRLAILRPESRRLRLDRSRAPAVRARLASQGVTGVKFVDLDFFTGPAELLPFPTPPRTIPTQVSLFKDLEQGLDAIGSRLTRLIDQMTSTLDKVELLVDDLRAEDIPGRLAAAIDTTTATVTRLRRLIANVDRAALPAKAARSLANVDAALARVDRLVAQVAGDAPGLLASARRATDAAGRLGRAATGSVDELDLTLRDIAEAARSLRELADELERDPDMFLKGRARSKAP